MAPLTKVNMFFRHDFNYIICPYCNNRVLRSANAIFRSHPLYVEYELWQCNMCLREWVTDFNWLDGMKLTLGKHCIIDIYLFDYPCNEALVGDLLIRRESDNA